MQMDFREEQILTGQLDAMPYPHLADVTAEPRGANRLHHRLVRAGSIDGLVCAEPTCEILDRRHALVAALGDDVGRAEFAGKSLARLMPAHHNYPLGAQLLGRKDPEQSRQLRPRAPTAP